VSIGVASHISAASAGGLRYALDIAEADRTSPENGIWLCQSCSRLVDNDSERYTTTILLEWKRDAEAKALDCLESVWSKDGEVGQQHRCQLSVIQDHSFEFDSREPRTTEDGPALLKEIGRAIHHTIKVAFLEALESRAPAQFVYLLSSVYHRNQATGVWTFNVRVVCHVSPFVQALAGQWAAIVAGGSIVQRPDVTIRYRHVWTERKQHIPYRISMLGPTIVSVECLEATSVRVTFPMSTSDLLRVFAGMAAGQIVFHDDLQFSDPVQLAFVKYMQYVTEQRSFSFLDVAVDPDDPEKWSLPVTGADSLSGDAS
jgi:hypothetical protein